MNNVISKLREASEKLKAIDLKHAPHSDGVKKEIADAINNVTELLNA